MGSRSGFQILEKDRKLVIVTRYHPLLVTLHWAVGLLVLGNLIVGMFLLEPLKNSDPAKLEILRWHMVGGIAILVLMIARLVTRLRTRKPPPAIGALWVHRLARATHFLMYLAIFAMVTTGLGVAQLGGFLPLLGGAAVSLPESFASLPPFAGHELFAKVLVVLIILHLIGTAYHIVRKREPLLRRMWFGARET